MRVQHARDCNPCPSPHAHLSPAPLVTEAIPRTVTDIDSPAATQASGQRDKQRNGLSSLNLQVRPVVVQRVAQKAIF